MSNANVALVRKLYDAYKGGDIATVLAALAPDVAWHSHGRPQDHPALGLSRGPQGVQKFFQTVAEVQTPDEFSPHEFYAIDDKVFVRGRYRWTMRKTGKPVSAEWIHVFTIKDGKVAAFDEFTDTAQFAEALRG